MTRMVLEGGLHSATEEALLEELAGGVPPGWAIIEIGSYTGVSAMAMAYGAGQGRGAHVTCIDPWPQPRPGEPDQAHAERQRHAEELFKRNMALALWPVTALKAWSTDVAKMWIQPVGMLFIDGDHRYEAVRADYEAWLPHLAPGCWLVMHDYIGEVDGVARVVDELIRPSGLWNAAAPVDTMWIARRT